MFRNDETGRFSMVIDPDTKDLKCDDSFDTDIHFSLFTDRRADSSEVTKPELRRGWEGDVVAVLQGYLAGSKWWLNEQSRWTQKVVNKYVYDTESALKHFIQRGIATRIAVTGRLISVGKIEIKVVFYVDNNEIASYTTQIWQQSRYLGVNNG